MAPSLPLPPSADSTYFQETGDIISDLFEPVKGPADDFLKEYHRKGPIRFRKGIRDLVVRITEDVIPVSFNCLAVPKQDSCCHLTAQIRAASSCSLLPIPAHLFIGETALGQIYLPQPDKDDNLLLTLCREPKLRVTRSLIRRDTQKPDPNRTQHTSFFRIDLTNTGDRPRSLQVLDQIPVSEDPDVCVELIEAGGAQLTPVTGELKWELLLRPGESRSLTFGFTVTHPAGQRLFL